MFKVNDRVRCVHSNGPWSMFVVGEEYTVSEIRGRLIGVQCHKRVSEDTVFETAYNNSENFELVRKGATSEPRRFVKAAIINGNAQLKSSVFTDLDELKGTCAGGNFVIYELTPVLKAVTETVFEDA